VLSQVVELIENKNNFGITTHIKPDGDGVGSSLGLCWLLRSLGKHAEVIVHGNVPQAYRSLPGADDIRDIKSIDAKYDAVFIIECSDLERPGISGLDTEFTVNIDHHATSAHFGTINWIDSTASAVVSDLCLAWANSCWQQGWWMTSLSSARCVTARAPVILLEERLSRSI